MEPELAALAASAATTLTGLMVTDGWTQTRTRLGALFAHTTQAPALAAEMEAARSALISAARTHDTRIPAQARADLESRLRQLLHEDPRAQVDLRALLAAIDPANRPAPPAPSVHNSISGSTLHGPLIQAGTVTGLTLSSAADPAVPPRPRPTPRA